MQKLTPVENQIAVQINRRRSFNPLVLDVRDYGSLTVKEREDVRRRYGVDGGFAVVYTRSSEDREVAMKSLMKEGLFFGAPDLKVQSFGECENDVEMDDILESIEDSPSPLSVIMVEEPASPCLSDSGSTLVRYEKMEVSFQGLEDQLFDDMKKMDLRGEEEDTKML